MKKEYPVPKFSSIEEEDRFWQSHSPLMEDYEGKVQKRKQNRASFLSIRLTGEELAQLRETAAHYGLAPSTYARQLLIQGMELQPRPLLPDVLLATLCKQVDFVSGEQKKEYLERLSEIVERYLKVQESIAPQIAALYSLSHKNDETKELHHKQMVR